MGEGTWEWGNLGFKKGVKGDVVEGDLLCFLSGLL